MILAESLEAPDVRHAFFTRRGGISTGIYESFNCGPGSSDNPQHISENRTIAAEHLGVAQALLCTTRQVHSNDVVFVTKPWPATSRPRADAMVTQTPGIALGVLTADCTPILLFDPIARCIGVAHAGWQGALRGIIPSTIRAMEEIGARPAAIRAAIGPTIQQASYEVGPEFHTRFLAEDAVYETYFRPGHRPGRFLFDLPGFVESALRKSGVDEIERLARDTYSEDSYFFSYRRTTHRGETDYGRQLSAIALVGQRST